MKVDFEVLPWRGMIAVRLRKGDQAGLLLLNTEEATRLADYLDGPIERRIGRRVDLPPDAMAILAQHSDSAAKRIRTCMRGIS